MVTPNCSSWLHVADHTTNKSKISNDNPEHAPGSTDSFFPASSQ